MDAEKDQIKSNMGTLCTLMWFGIIIFYAINKIDILVNKKGNTILAATKEFNFSQEDEFDYSHGFNVAAAFTAYDNTTTWSLDPSYGELVIASYEWGYREDGAPFVENLPLGMHNCSRKELHLDGAGEGTRFYPVSD